MNKNEWKKSIGVVGRMLLAYALVFVQGAWAGEKTKDKADSPQKTAAQQIGEKPSSASTATKAQTQEAPGEASESAVAEEKSSRDASHQGIKVHGHWTIEIRDPDGSLAKAGRKPPLEIKRRFPLFPSPNNKATITFQTARR